MAGPPPLEQRRSSDGRGRSLGLRVGGVRARANGTGGDRPLVLIADDEDAVRAGLSDAFRAAGYRVRAARDGMELISLAAREAPAAIVLDLAMPVADGFAAARALRMMDGTRTVPIIAATASWLGNRLDLMGGAGFDAVLRKPFAPAVLVREVERTLSTLPAAGDDLQQAV